MRIWAPSLTVLLAVAGLLVSALLFIWNRLPWVVERTLAASLPGIEARVGKIEINSGILKLHDLSLRLHEEPAPFFTFRGLTLKSRLQDALSLQAEHIELIEPFLRITPAVVFFFTRRSEPSDTPRTGSRHPLAWFVRRIVCQFGTLEIQTSEPASLQISSRFSADLRDLGPASPAKNEVVFWNLETRLRGQPGLSLDLLRVGFSLPKLLARKGLEFVETRGGEVIISPEMLSLMQPGPQQKNVHSSGFRGQPFLLGLLEIKQLKARLPPGPFATNLEFAVSTKLSNIPLLSAPSLLSQEIQSVTFENLEIYSPLDALARVLQIRELTAEFSLAGLLRSEIQTIRVTAPTIHVGQDLFWYMEDSQRRLAKAQGGGGCAGARWKIKNFHLSEGRLVIGSAGRKEFGIPLTFFASANDIEADNLASLRAAVALQIPSRTYAFPEYQLEFSTRDGELRFAYPPAKNQNNLVGTISIPQIRWRQYEAGQAWLTVTFDRSGINGEFGGATYRGYSTGGFSFFFDAESPWIGWLSGRNLDMARITSILSPENFLLTGPATFRLQVDAKRTTIQRVKGDFSITRPGRMEIRKLDELLDNIPRDWPAFRQDATRIALNALRDYEFNKCQSDFWFVENQGVLTLALKGPTGSRNFEVVLHADDSPQGRWKIPQKND